MLHNIDLFQVGLKKAYLAKQWEKGYNELVSKYPFSQNGKQRVFFHSSEVCEHFKEAGIREDGLFNDRLLGTLLGFPPTAINDFERGIPERHRIAVCYHGLYFIVHRRHVKEALSWLQVNMPIPADLIKDHASMVEIRYYGKKENGCKDFLLLPEKKRKKVAGF